MNIGSKKQTQSRTSRVMLTTVKTFSPVLLQAIRSLLYEYIFCWPILLAIKLVIMTSINPITDLKRLTAVA